MKYDLFLNRIKFLAVASFMDAWIEIGSKRRIFVGGDVASFMDAWIEIPFFTAPGALKSVASFMDAWIEINSADVRLVV